MVKREVFDFKTIVDTSKNVSDKPNLLDLLPKDDLYFMIKPIKTYGLIHYRRLYTKDESQ